MNTSVRIGVLGTGYWGKNLLRNFAELNALSAAFDISDEAKRRTIDKYPGIKHCTDEKDLFTDPNIDAVAIATPAATHARLALMALEAGKHVFVEKPLALSVTEAESVVAKAEMSGLILMVGHLLLYHPAFDTMKKLVEDDAIGPLRYIYSNRLSLGKIRQEENALWSFAPHDVSMILSLVGALPTEVMATGGKYLQPEIDDISLTCLGFAGGIKAHIFVSWLHPYKDHKMVVIGETGMLAFDDTRPDSEKLSLYRHVVDLTDGLPTINKAEGQLVPYDWIEPLRQECSTFIRAVANGTPPPSDGQEGIRVLRIIQSAQESILAGKKISL